MAAQIIGARTKAAVESIQHEVEARSYQAANELRTAALYVLRGQRGGRRYKMPNSRRTYQASAPGEPPAVRTGAFRNSWAPRVGAGHGTGTYNVNAMIESNLRVGKYLLGGLLEDGTSRMAARPYKQRVKDRALPKIKQIYSRPYKV